MPLPTKIQTPSIDDVKVAATRLAGVAVKTPLLESPLLNERLGGRVLLKAEVLQRTGSFKFRGAYNCISTIEEGARKRGVVAFSAGNHAQGVAFAASLFGIPSVIAMPEDAPTIKVANTRSYGAEIVFYNRMTDDREAIGQTLSEERGLTFVKPYDDPWVIAGQGTIGLEIASQARDAGAVIDAALVPTSGGGLTAGTALALTGESPKTAIYSVEADAYNDTQRSLETGVRQRNAEGATSICDALQSPTPGELTFAINGKLLAGGLSVSDKQALAGMEAAFRYFKLVVEPGGAVALAAVINRALDVRGKTVVVVASGGNVDPKIFDQALAVAA